MTKKPKILVVGSFTMDLIVSSEKFPESGETVIGCGFSTAPGGKGANQALQAAKLGAQVTMVGRVGKDNFGKEIINSMEMGGVDISHVKIDSEAPTAIGNIQLQVTESGTANRIIVFPGANMRITQEDIAFLKDSIGDYDFVMLQHEIPQSINETVAEYAFDFNIPVMLNPAPSAPISQNLLSKLAYLSPNEHEAYDITGTYPDSDINIKKAADFLISSGAKNVLITLGKKGSAFSDGSDLIKSPSIDCGSVVDPTAAGDSFIAAFCTALASGLQPDEAMAFANFTAGITVTRMGAQTSLPNLSEVISLMNKNGYKTTGGGIFKWTC